MSRALSIIPKTDGQKALEGYLASICKAETIEEIMEATDGVQPSWTPEEMEKAETEKDPLSLYNQAARNLERFGIGGC